MVSKATRTYEMRETEHRVGHAMAGYAILDILSAYGENEMALFIATDF